MCNNFGKITRHCFRAPSEAIWKWSTSSMQSPPKLQPLSSHITYTPGWQSAKMVIRRRVEVELEGGAWPGPGYGGVQTFRAISVCHNLGKRLKGSCKCQQGYTRTQLHIHSAGKWIGKLRMRVRMWVCMWVYVYVNLNECFSIWLCLLSVCVANTKAAWITK